MAQVTVNSKFYVHRDDSGGLHFYTCDISSTTGLTCLGRVDAVTTFDDIGLIDPASAELKEAERKLQAAREEEQRLAERVKSLRASSLVES
jgi:hypothetical protein